MTTLSRNIASNLLGQGLVLLFGLVAGRHLYHGLGEDAFGIIWFSISMGTILHAALDLGIGSTAVRETAAHFPRDPGYVIDLARTASVFTWTLFLVAAAVLYAATPWIMEHWVRLKTLDAAEATYAMRVLGPATLLILPRQLYANLIRGLERMQVTNGIDVGAMAIQQLGIVAVLELGGTLRSVVLWMACSMVLWTVGYGWMVGRLMGVRALRPRLSSSVIRRNLKYAISMTWISVLAMIHSQADKIILSRLLPVGSFGAYAFGYGGVARATLLTGAVAQAALPSLSSKHGAGDIPSMKAQYLKVHDLLCAGMMPLFAAVPFATLPVFSAVFNPEVARTMLLPLTLLAVGFYMNGTLNMPYVYSLAVGKPGITVASNRLALIVVLPATVALVYGWGLVGAGLSWIVYHLFAYAVAVPRLCRECLEVPRRSWYLHVLKWISLGGSIYGAAWIGLGLAGVHSLAALVLAYGAATGVYLMAAWAVASHELKETLVRMVRGRP